MKNGRYTIKNKYNCSNRKQKVSSNVKYKNKKVYYYKYKQTIEFKLNKEYKKPIEIRITAKDKLLNTRNNFIIYKNNIVFNNDTNTYIKLHY